MDIHFLNVGCGNMVLIQTSTANVFYDCNITDENEGSVLRYLRKVLPSGSHINVFVCSHRDADHMRGIKKLHSWFPIHTISDSGIPRNTTDSSEYQDYMDLRRSLRQEDIVAHKYQEYGNAKFRWMNAKSEDYSDPNEQSIVLKVEHQAGASCLLAGDTNFRPWKEKILPFYGDEVKSSILLAPHHGSITFFDDPSERYYYVDHVKKINPAMTVISVGPNSYGLPDKASIDLYDKYSTGSDKSNKVFMTEKQGNMRLSLKDDGNWSLFSDE